MTNCPIPLLLASALLFSAALSAEDGNNQENTQIIAETNVPLETVENPKGDVKLGTGMKANIKPDLDVKPVAEVKTAAKPEPDVKSNFKVNPEPRDAPSTNILTLSILLISLLNFAAVVVFIVFHAPWKARKPTAAAASKESFDAESAIKTQCDKAVKAIDEKSKELEEQFTAASAALAGLRDTLATSVKAAVAQGTAELKKEDYKKITDGMYAQSVFQQYKIEVEKKDAAEKEKAAAEKAMQEAERQRDEARKQHAEAQSIVSRLENVAAILPPEHMALFDSMPGLVERKPTAYAVILAFDILWWKGAKGENDKDAAKTAFQAFDTALARLLEKDEAQLVRIREAVAPKANEALSPNWKIDWPKPGDRLDDQAHYPETTSGNTVRFAKTAVIRDASGAVSLKARVLT